MQMPDWIKSARSDSGFPNKGAFVAAISEQQQLRNYIAHHGMQFLQPLQHQLLTESRGCE